MGVRAILFDLGDTLIFQARAPDDAVYARMAEQVRPLLHATGAGAAVDAGSLVRDLYDAVRTAQPQRRARGEEVDGPFIARGALAAYGVSASEELAERFWRATDVGYDLWGAQTYPDAVDTLRRLRTLGVHVALVSNNWFTGDVVRSQLKGVGITSELLPVVVTSADVMRVKPDPAPFLRALEALNLAPADAAFIGDDLDADVRGAKALGMATIWKLNGRHEVPPAPEADYAIHDLWELFTLRLLQDTAAAVLPHESLTPHEDANADRY